MSSSWARIADLSVRQERPLQPFRTLLVKGSVDVLFRRDEKPMLIVAGASEKAVDAVKTSFQNGKLVVEREGVAVSMVAGRNIFIHAAGDVVVSGDRVVVAGLGQEDAVVVGLALPEAPTVNICGSGDVTLVDLRQERLDLTIEGSGDITAHGQVAHLEIEVAGSGDVDASELIADRARLSVAGSGDIEAFVRSDVHARVAGSGDILVRGSPPNRDHSVAGSGKIKFR